jgi:drug/metabolite transporter (DMT)-like permease
MGIEPIRLLQLAIYALLLASGQLLFKQVALQSAAIRDVSSAAYLFLQPYFLTALGLYGLATVLWIYLLQRMSLAIAYAFVAVVFALVPLGAWYFFGERLTWTYGLGAMLVMAGVVLIGASACQS